MDGRTDGRTDGQTEGWTDGRTDGLAVIRTAESEVVVNLCGYHIHVDADLVSSLLHGGVQLQFALFERRHRLALIPQIPAKALDFQLEQILIH